MPTTERISIRRTRRRLRRKLTLRPWHQSFCFAPRNDALEIGTGTGAFLSALRQLGFANMTGIEPSPAAIDAADRIVRPFIRGDIFVETDFVSESFDLICCFMTLEHVWDPRRLVEGCSRLLRKGGILRWSRTIIARRSTVFSADSRLSLISNIYRYSVDRASNAC